MPTLIQIVEDWFDRSWGARKSGSKSKLPEFERSPYMWRKSSPWVCTPEDVSYSQTKESRYTGRTYNNLKWNLRHAWESVRLGYYKGDIPGEEQLNPLIPRLLNKRVVLRLKARVRSSGLKASMLLKRELASSADNTLFIGGTLQDGSPLQAAVWFERAHLSWTMQSYCGVSIRNLDAHADLHAIWGYDTTLRLDEGIKSLTFSRTPMLVESSVSTAASSTTMPILTGTHYYLGFKFGDNLQDAVRERMPLVLISQPGSRIWRSTPFDLNFDEVRLRKCVLVVSVQKLDEYEETYCYIIGRGLGGQRYHAELGSDNSVLRWNLWLKPGLDFDPPDVAETDSEENALLAGGEDDFFHDSPGAYPGLGDPARFDDWLGGAAWRSGASTSRIYASLQDPQFIHLQFGIALTNLTMTDAAITFRGLPTFEAPDEHFEYHRAFFRIAIGPPFNDGLRRITHESHMRVLLYGIPCEGFFEPGEERTILSLVPVNDDDAATLTAHFGITVESQYPVTHFSLRYDLATGKHQVFATNDFDFQTPAPEEPL